MLDPVRTVANFEKLKSTKKVVGRKAKIEAYLKKVER